MAGSKGDYLGFTFGGRHSSEFGIVRTSSSNRYEDKLNGTLKDNTQARTNADGTFYFGTNISQKQFAVNFAFDHMTDTQLNDMKKWLNPKEIKDLIFDEDNPDISTFATTKKIWKAKVTGQTSVKHLCFDESGQRIYKGDGSIQFTCYCPCAFGIELNSPDNNTISIVGDLETSFIWSKTLSDALSNGKKYSLKTDGNEVASITLNTNIPTNSSGYAQRIEWNSEKGLVYLVETQSSIEKNRTILPISGNSIFKLQPGSEYGVYDGSSCVGRISYIPRYL